MSIELEQVTKRYGERSVVSDLALSIATGELERRIPVRSPDELGTLCEVAHALKMSVHMDGARFANALATTGDSPADATWRAGVDAMSFGFVITLQVEADKVRSVNRYMEQKAWGAFRYQVFPAYDFAPIAANLKTEHA